METILTEHKDPLLVELEVIQTARTELINELVKDKTSLLGDPQKLEAFIKLTSANDKSSLGRMKVKVDQSANDINKQANKLLAALLVNPATKTIGMSDTPTDRCAPELPPNFMEISLVPGELDQGIVTEDHASFIQRAKEKGLVKS